MIKVIIFDSDGVITSSKMFSEDLQRDFGISSTLLTPFFNTAFKKCLIGKADLKEELKKHINNWGWKGSVDELVEYWFVSEHEINEKVVEIIKDIKQKGVKCYLGTNQEQYRTDYMRKRMGFAELFDGIWSSSEVGAIKSEQYFFESVYGQISDDGKISKNEIMFWDDSEINVLAAKEFGFQAYQYCDFEKFKKTIVQVLNLGV